MKTGAEIKAELVKLFHSERGKDFLLFLVFLAISTILWLVFTLNEEVQKDIRCKVEITNIPNNVTLINDAPKYINASVKAKGFQFVPYIYSKTPIINIDFNSYKSDNRLIITGTEMKGILRSQMGLGASVLAISPDSINVMYTTGAGELVPLKIDANVSTSAQFTISGEIKANIDSVRVYTANGIRQRTTHITTAPINLSNLNKKTAIEVKLNTPNNTKIVPSSAIVTIDVEPLISKKRNIPIDVINTPSNISVVIFPAQVEVNYLVPMSLYKNIEPNFKAYADYNSHNGHKLSLKIKNIPEGYQNVFLSIDSVEFLIEHK